jgi:putative FmdB family regulatory protein
MPFYGFDCSSCGANFSRRLSVDARDTPQVCPECGVPDVTREISVPMFNLPGDDYPGKNHRIARQMERKNRILETKQEVRKREAGVRLVPNVEGEKVDSWAEAAKLAASKGKDTAGYVEQARKVEALRSKPAPKI